MNSPGPRQPPLRDRRRRPEVGALPLQALHLADERDPSAVFSVRGPHELWDGFGGARNHQGADIGAACGTPLVAALPGKIETNKYESRGGDYLVIDVEGSSGPICGDIPR